MGADFNVDVLYTDSTGLLIVGGGFTNVDGQPKMGIAIWDSSNWSSFGNNSVFQNFGSVSAITKFNMAVFSDDVKRIFGSQITKTV